MKEIDPEKTNHGITFKLWNDASMPMITCVKTMDVTRLRRYGKKHGYSFNMLMCYCIGHAASRIPDFYVLPVADKLIQYDQIAISLTIPNRHKKYPITFLPCTIPFSQNLDEFNQSYQEQIKNTDETGEFYYSEDYMTINTSVIIDCEFDAMVGLYSKENKNPVVLWSKYHKTLFKTTMKVSFQFNHVQLDGIHVKQFFLNLQEAMNSF